MNLASQESISSRYTKQTANQNNQKRPQPFGCGRSRWMRNIPADSSIAVPAIVQNLHFVQCNSISPAYRVINNVACVYSTNVLICSVLCGSDFMQRYLQRYLLWIQSSQGDSAKAWIKLKQTLTCDGVFVEDLNLYFDEYFCAWQFPNVPLLHKDDCKTPYQRQFGSRFGWTWEV